MLHYVEADLVSAGLPHDPNIKWRVSLEDAKLPFDERWAQFERYWPDCRLTGYGKALRRCAKDLYGVDLDKLTPQTGKELNARMAAALKPGLYKWVLKDKARIDVSISDTATLKLDPDFFRSVLRFDNFVCVNSRSDLEPLSKRTGVQIKSLDDLVKSLEVAIETGKRDGMVGIKSGLA